MDSAHTTARGYPRAATEGAIRGMPSPGKAGAAVRARRRRGAPPPHAPRGDAEKESAGFQAGAAPGRIALIAAASGLRLEADVPRAAALDTGVSKRTFPGQLTSSAASGPPGELGPWTLRRPWKNATAPNAGRARTPDRRA